MSVLTTSLRVAGSHRPASQAKVRLPSRNERERETERVEAALRELVASRGTAGEPGGSGIRHVFSRANTLGCTRTLRWLS
jgi:hypothetical protein